MPRQWATEPSRTTTNLDAAPGPLRPYSQCRMISAGAQAFEQTKVVRAYVCAECGAETCYDGNGGEICHAHPQAKITTLRALYTLALVEPV